MANTSVKPQNIGSLTGAAAGAAATVLRHSSGTYFHWLEGSVLHCQTTLPPANDGVSTMLRVVPIEESLPLIVIVPVSVTEPPEIRPAVVTVKPVPAPSKDPLTVATSAMVVLKLAAATISSETLARVV